MRGMWVVLSLTTGCLVKPEPPGGTPLRYVKVFVDDTYSGFTFTKAASAAGNAIIIDLAADGFGASTQTIAAPGWTFMEIGHHFNAASFGAIAPDTNPTTFTMTRTSINQNIVALGDEFTNNDPAGGPTTFDAHIEKDGIGDCCAVLHTEHANVAVWSACATGAAVQAAAKGYTQTANSHGNGSEYKVTSDPAGTDETVGFSTTNPNAQYSMVTVSIKPR